jgi:hypothetical protein
MNKRIVPFEPEGAVKKYLPKSEMYGEILR